MYTRIHRLLKVLMLVQGRDGWTPGKLARECGVDERTIYRDLNELEGAGIPIEFDQAAGGYRVAKEVFLPPVHLTPDEAVWSATAGQFVDGDGFSLPFPIES